MEQRTVLSANVALAVLRAHVCPSGDVAGSQNEVVASSQLNSQCTVATGAQPIERESPSSPADDASGDSTVVVATIKTIAPENSDTTPCILIAASADASAADAATSTEKVVPDDASSQSARGTVSEGTQTLTTLLLNSSLPAISSQESTSEATDPTSADVPVSDAVGIIVNHFGGTNEETPSGESANSDPLRSMDESPDERGIESPVAIPETPILYTLGGNVQDGNHSTTDPVSAASGAAMRRKDVKQIAREIKRGHEVDLNVPALLQLHSTAKKDTRKMIERVIATTYAQCHAPSCVALPPSSKQQATDAAYATLGAPTKTLKINGRRYVAPTSG